jgi:two-component system cell cycle sensor histidine kinase/response regulator CckA
MGRGVVLVVDDEPTVCATLTRFLRNAGFSVHEASDGVHALEILEGLHWRVDAVLTDLIMPRLAGLGLIDRIHERAPAIAVLGMSGTPAVASGRPWAPILAKPLILDDVVLQLTRGIEVSRTVQVAPGADGGRRGQGTR